MSKSIHYRTVMKNDTYILMNQKKILVLLQSKIKDNYKLKNKVI